MAKAQTAKTKPAKKSAFTKENPMPLRPELPDEVTVTFKLNKGKYMYLRQHIASGEIEGHEINTSYSLNSGACIIQIGNHAYEGDMREMIQSVFDQIAQK